MYFTNCYLCADLDRDAQASGIAQLYGPSILKDAFIWESQDFYITPAPGTIAVGYLILAPKAHVPSFARLSLEQLVEVASIVDHVVKLGKQLGFEQYIAFEHGSVSFHSRGAACVDHAHLHLTPAPNFSEFREVLQGSFNESLLEGIADLADWPKDTPYVLLTNNATMYCYAAPHAPSQLLRRVLASQWSIGSQWNWRLHPLKENFCETIRVMLGKFDNVEL